MVDLALPDRVLRPSAGVGGHLHILAADLLGAGQLQLRTGLVCAGQHRPAHRHLQRVPVAAGISHAVHASGQPIHCPADGNVVTERPAGHLQPGPVQCPLKLAGHGVGRGSGQVLPGAQRLAVAGVQQVVQCLVGVDGGRRKPQRPV